VELERFDWWESRCLVVDWQVLGVFVLWLLSVMVLGTWYANVIASLTPSWVLSSYAAAKRMVSLCGFVSAEIVVVVLVMVAEHSF
jgi:hypothetical protein